MCGGYAFLVIFSHKYIKKRKICDKTCMVDKLHLACGYKKNIGVVVNIGIWRANMVVKDSGKPGNILG